MLEINPSTLSIIWGVTRREIRNFVGEKESYKQK